jgi:DmsE family decaheme c-type cytochrome
MSGGSDVYGFGKQCCTQATWPEKHCMVRMPDTMEHLPLPDVRAGVMCRPKNGPTIVDRNGTGRSAAVAYAIRLLLVVVSGLTYWAISTLPAGADIEHSEHASFHVGAGAHFHFQDPDLAALRDYAQQAGLEQPKSASVRDSKRPHHHFDDPDLATLRDYGQQVAGDHPDTADMPRLRVAEADSAFDALRQFLRRGEQPDSAPKSNPAPRAAPPPPRPAAPRHDPPIVHGHFLGERTCLFCHAPEAAAFGKTLMGRVARTTHKGKLDCESCHGPGSAHVRAVGCAACHGEGGITSKVGIPSLIGQDPQYLVPAMKAYLTGQRKYELKKVLLSGLSDAELNSIAQHYARQPAARAQTPPVGDAAAGRSATASCSGCHGAQGISIAPAWPSLAGQDARYLADAIKAYKHGSRSKVIACAACHGEGGITRRPGTPSLVGMGPQYLVAAMKAYASGQRRNDLKKALLAGVSDAELNNIALFYARQAPARAQTALIGDPSAGKAASSLCVSCHGDQGGSVVPAWPGLAGQDAQYLAEATKAYKQGSRSKVVACAACHGEGGISKLPGIPSLAGLMPQYLVGAMEDYVAGQRKHELKKALFTGMTAAELNDIAQYYAAQPSARASTPLVGNPSAGQAASAVCAGCHGAQGISTNPEWPSLAGQDAKYFADAMKAYKNGSRDDAVMKRLAVGLDERTINDLASYYATLTPAPPSVPRVAGKRDPVLAANRLVAALDERTINNIASHFASLAPAPPPGTQNAPAGREPVVVRNGLVAFLDDRAINNVASYYASLRPAQPESVRRAPGGREPALVRTAERIDGRSVGGIISFRKDDPSRRVEDNNAMCLSCHERGGQTYWSGSVHETRAVACTECHTVMVPVSRKFALKTKTEPETCFQCHKDQRAKIFRSAHMPIREGKVTCSNCHNPHGSATEALLTENSINDNCYKCHAEKRGPFLFEHAPVRQNCLSCHDAHGSNTEYMLKVSRPRLCAECHGFGHGGLTSGPRSVETFGRSCQNCHTAVHGSNSPSGPLLQR